MGVHGYSINRFGNVRRGRIASLHPRAVVRPGVCFGGTVHTRGTVNFSLSPLSTECSDDRAPATFAQPESSTPSFIYSTEYSSGELDYL